jgi:hypothetical protein
MDILFNPAGLSYGPLQGYIQFAAWLWSHRTGISLTFGGTTTESTPASGQIIIRNAKPAEWAEYGGNAEAPNAYTIQDNESSLILFNPHIPPQPLYDKLIIHEIGHALGFFSMYGAHSGDRDDVMHPSIGEHSFPLSMADANGVLAFGSMLRTNEPDTKCSVLMPDFDIAIPDINGKQVLLDYRGLNANGKHAWIIASITDNEESAGCPTYVSGDRAFIHSLHSMGQDYANVELSIVGSHVQLESFVLA